MHHIPVRRRKAPDGLIEVTRVALRRQLKMRCPVPAEGCWLAIHETV